MSLSFEEAGFATALSLLSFLGAVRLRALRMQTTSWQDVVAHGAHIAKQLHWPESHCTVLAAEKRSLLEQAKRDAETLSHEQITTLTDEDDAFPALLKHIDDPPAFLHMRGTALGTQPAIAVVGTRSASPYGMESTRTVASDLASDGCVIVSGLALGIDTAAHEGALAAGGITWAFPGSGLLHRRIYPANNQKLAQQIIENGGALFSEFPPQLTGFRHLFPIRNRLIAGATLGTLVTEAKEQSGALMTAHAALGYNRLVFALPGDITRPQSVGPNRLLRAGAIPITGKQDILEALDIPLHVPADAPRVSLTKEEHVLIAHLAHTDATADDLTRESSIPASHVASAISNLELLGIVRCILGQWHLTDRGKAYTRP